MQAEFTVHWHAIFSQAINKCKNAPSKKYLELCTFPYTMEEREHFLWEAAYKVTQ